jgi:asparagine synthase (glutamine-hydrolysing)
MCGIAGIVAFDGVVSVEQMRGMADSLAHRGPDDFGYWISEGGNTGFAHRRLSIQDLSAMGKQPMHSASERYVVCYNGEIYNFEALRAEIDALESGHAWRGNSDTEVLLASIDAWGFAATLSRLVGMFAIALWDRAEGQLYLARDRLGEKPLYYGILGERLVFSSELKAIRAVAEGRLEIDRESVAQYMRFGYVPAPRSIYRQIHKLPSAHYLRIAVETGEMGEPIAFWNPPAVDGATAAALASQDDAALTELVHQSLQQSIALQTVADVPHGAFLSGGVDSSLVVGIMQAQSKRPVRTFTIGFDNASLNEAPFAKAVAAHLGTEHTEMFVTANDALAIIDALPQVYDEPFADSSQIPTLLVSRLTRRHVTVALSGDGGDELFAGYPRYQLVESLWRRAASVPRAARSAAAGAIRTLSPQSWDRLLGVLPASMARTVNGRRLHHLAGMGACDNLGDMYVRLMTRWQPEDKLVLGASGVPAMPLPEGRDDVDALRRWDIAQYLQDDLLVKVDRASMNASLETRAPMLDHRVVDLALQLPRRMLIREGAGKWVLRQVLDRYVPRALIERPKAGFEVPLAEWLRGGLKNWAEALLDPTRIAREGYLDPARVQEAWHQHQSGIADRSLHLWHILMFEVWLDAIGEGA